jgi:hypothetical protein
LYMCFYAYVCIYAYHSQWCLMYLYVPKYLPSTDKWIVNHIFKHIYKIEKKWVFNNRALNPTTLVATNMHVVHVVICKSQPWKKMAHTYMVFNTKMFFKLKTGAFCYHTKISILPNCMLVCFFKNLVLH